MIVQTGVGMVVRSFRHSSTRVSTGDMLAMQKSTVCLPKAYRVGDTEQNYSSNAGVFGPIHLLDTGGGSVNVTV